jgi:hypothetical protein
VLELDRVTVDDFAPAVGQVFAIDAGDAGTIELELTEVSAYDPKAPAVDQSGKRAPFHVLFRGPPEPIVAQQICRLQNDTLGAIEIFIVPIGSDESGTSYEAVFT